ncbi:transcriptional regulator domain-containing protein [Tardiphaga sp. 862_B3_N4_1]|uniref:transcriptional regulator domain-containing protein n=1 Tax=Hyphomicrobiales TaxID=356 RepID=UPI003728B5B5
MIPETTGWRRSPEYDFMDEVGIDDLAWECLRRNSDYQKDFANLSKTAKLDEPLPPKLAERWGLRFRRPAKPKQC